MEISHVLETDIHSFQLEQCDGWVLEIVGRGIWAGQTSPSVSQFLHLANCLRRKNNRCRADLATSLPSTPSLVLHTVTSTYSSHHLPPSLPCPLLLNTSCLPSRQQKERRALDPGIGRTGWVVIITVTSTNFNQERKGGRKRLFPLLGNINQCPFTPHQVNIRNVKYLMPACQMPRTLTGRARQSTGREKGKTEQGTSAHI